MRVLLTAFFSLAAGALVWATGVKSTERFTIHIGSRLPPAELGASSQGTSKRMRDAASRFSSVRSEGGQARVIKPNDAMPSKQSVDGSNPSGGVSYSNGFQ